MASFVRANVTCDEPGCVAFTSAIFEVSDGYVGAWDNPSGWARVPSQRTDIYGGIDPISKFYCPNHKDGDAARR